MLRLQPAHRLRVLEPLGQRWIDEDRIQPVDGLAVFLEQVGGADGDVGQRPCLRSGLGGSVAGPGWRQIWLSPKVSWRNMPS